jgi:hypothetical protein
MTAIRTSLDGEVGGILLNAHRLADWKYYVRAYPWVTTLAAVAVGFLAVPSKAKPAEITIPPLNQSANPKKETKVSAPVAAAAASGGILGSLASMASSFALKMALNYASQQFKDRWMANPGAGPTESARNPSRQTVPS